MPNSGTIHFAGRACRLPMANSVDEFAQLLYSGTCAIREIPENRWRKAPFYHPVPGTKGKAYSFAAGVLDRAEAFDAAPFGISPREAEYMDPQQRLLLQVVWEALEDACIVPSDLAGRNVGVYVGASMMDHAGNLTADPALADSYMMTGSSLAVIANRVSHVFDLKGPSLTIDTACSSSLFALEAAVRALASGEIDTAIVGATNMLMTPAFFIGFSEARMLSPTGVCQAFSEKADGYVRGEGAVAFVLRRQEPGAPPLPRDHGRLVHVGVNTTGKSINIALPSADAQTALLDKVYRQAGIAPDQLAFVEAHGTGTPVGDPIEAEALGRALGRRRASALPIGSVKSNIGHLEPAAGCAGLLKALVALENRRLPASLNAGPPNDAIPFADLGLRVADAPLDLELDDPDRRYAGVSAFGFGGANAHAIVRAAEPAPAVSVAAGEAGDDRVFFTSAFCREALKASAAAYRDRLFDPGGRPASQLFGSLLHFRGTHPERMAVLATGPADTDTAIEAAIGEQRHPALVTGRSGLTDQPPVFLFSGNGSQYPGMSLAALDNDRAYRERYEEIDTLWRDIAGWSLVDKARDPGLAEDIRRADIAQPLLFADQVAMVAGLAARGVTPAAVLGHSGGEVAAAAVAGALGQAEALNVLFARATAQFGLAGQGAMIAVQASEQDVAAALATGDFGAVSISAANSPGSVTVSGPLTDLDTFQRHARRVLRWAAVRLRVDYAFHHAMQNASEAGFRARLTALAPSPGRIPFISSVTGITEPGTRLGGEYWWRNVRQPVRFMDAVSTAAARGFRFFLEIGPNPVLGAYARDTLRELPDETAVTHAAEKSARPGPNPVQLAVARTLVHGGRVDRARLARRPRRAPEGLSTYPWQLRDMRVHERSRTVMERAASDPDFYPPLGRPVEGQAGIWLRETDVHMVPELADHVVAGKPIVPATAFADLCLAAARRVLGVEQVELRDLDFTSPLPLHARSIREVRTSVTGRRGETRISSRARFSEDPWQDHAHARALVLAAAEARPGGPAPALALDGDLEGERLYELGQKIGLEYGRDFRRVARYRLIGDRMIEVVLHPGPTATLHRRTALDPVGADSVLHGLLALPGTERFADAALGFVPIRIGRLLLFTPGVSVRTGRIRVREIGERSIHADIDLFGELGDPVACLAGVRFRAARLVRHIDLDRHVFAMDLVPIGDDLPLDLPAPAVLAKALGQAGVSKTGDEGRLLLDALAHRVAYDGLCALRDGQGIVIQPCPGDETAARYVEALAGMLEASDLVERTSAGLRPVKVSHLPAADDLIAGILEEHPELGGECAALARLAELMPDLLSGRLDWDLEALFGRAALTALTDGSVLRSAMADRITEALAKALPILGTERPLKVAEVTEGAPPIIDRLAPRAGHQVRWFAIGAEEPPALAATQAMPGPAVRPITTAEARTLGPFDLVIACPTALNGPEFAETTRTLVPHVRDGGLVVWLPQPRFDHFDLICAIGNNGSIDHPSIDLSAEPDGPATGLEVAPVRGGAIIAGIRNGEEALPARAGPATPINLPVKAPALVRALVSRLRHALPSFARAHSLVWHNAAGLWLLAPYRPANGEGAAGPVVVIAPNHRQGPAADQTLKRRLLMLARLFHAAPARPLAIWVIVPNGGATSASPGQTAVWATLRTAKNEYPFLDIRAVDPGEQKPARAAAALGQLIAGQTEETEIVLTSRGPAALRVRRGTEVTSKPPAGAATVRLVDDPAGGFDSLSWRRDHRPRPGPGQVLVEVAATGLNYRDVMWSMGVLPEEALEGGLAGSSLGIECAGRVIDAGDNTTGLAVGDLVAAVGPASFSSHLVVDGARALKLPPGWSPEAGAGLPVAFFTAWYGLHYLARLSEGETVLIHGGAGGVGLAAIQIARNRGARIIATAGSPAKRALLARLGADHVLGSRGPGFEAEARRVTGGEGVDVVLNALSGQSMERSIALLRPFGRFVELGKQDFYNDTPIGLRALKDNIGYFSADLDRLWSAKPDLAQRLFRDLMAEFEAGRLGPIPIRTYDGRDAISAFRTMQRSEHLGKIVVRPPRPKDIRQPVSPPIFRPAENGTMVIAGGASGLGLALAEHQMIRGASSIALIGRSPEPAEPAAALISRAAARCVEVTYESCDIARLHSVERTLARIRRRGPISDIVNAAMVLEDMRMADLTGAVLDRVLAAKIAGTRNLDRATRADPVRTFTVFSSLATLIGNHGQAAYVGANAYMEGLVRRRRAEGLPALSLGWGSISDTGYLFRNQDRAALLHRMGGGVDFTARQMVRAFDLLAAPQNQYEGDSVLWVSPMQWQSAVTGLRLLQGPTFQTLSDLGQQGDDTSETDDLRGRILSLPRQDARTRLVGFLRGEIARILRTAEGAIQTSRPVSEAGIDSLMGVELGMAAQQALGDDVPLMTISGANSIEEIAEKIVDHIQGAGTTDEDRSASSSDAKNPLTDVPSDQVSSSGHATAAE